MADGALPGICGNKIAAALSHAHLLCCPYTGRCLIRPPVDKICALFQQKISAPLVHPSIQQSSLYHVLRNGF